MADKPMGHRRGRPGWRESKRDRSRAEEEEISDGEDSEEKPEEQSLVAESGEEGLVTDSEYEGLAEELEGEEPRDSMRERRREMCMLTAERDLPRTAPIMYVGRPAAR